jgi:exopolysaccharide production protein ExoQ
MTGALSLPIRQAKSSERQSLQLYPAMVGFCFVFRYALMFLFFQSNPPIATAVTGLLDVLLVYGALLWSASPALQADVEVSRIPPLRWITALLAFTLLSVAWTGAPSVVTALGYWAAMASDVMAVLLLTRKGDAMRTTDSILKGAVFGAAALSLIGWCTPLTWDLRLGNEVYLHPNVLGMQIGLAALIAQYLSSRSAVWRWFVIALTITLLRTLSKTAILAYLAAGCWYLVKDSRWTRAAKLRIFAAALLVAACFEGLVVSYLDAYVTAGSGNKLETLTGRTALWTVAFSMIVKRPWFGHGLMSFKPMIPLVGDFAAIHAHNELVQQLFEFGIVGTAIVAGIYASFLRHARRSTAGELRTLVIALLIFALVRGLADAMAAELCYPLWLMTALAVSLTRQSGGEAPVS